jgi:hypothetical protein
MSSMENFGIPLPPGTIVFDHTMNSAAGGTNATVTYADVVTAAVAPLKPPLAFFEKPEPDSPTPMTYEDSGQVYGHLALWNSCHRGLMSGAFTECVKAPKSNTNYSQFHLGTMQTAEGEQVPIGKITFDTDHAPLTADFAAATKFYDNTGKVGAFVRAKDGVHGIWLSGVVRSDLPPEGLRDLRANPLSGDWRSFSHNLELIGSLAVQVPGFAIPRSQLALAASGDGGYEVSALILPALTLEDLEEEEALVASYSAGQIRKKRMLKSRVASLTAAVLSTKARNALSKSDFALPSTRSYPIHDEAHARNALARSAGKPEEGRVRAAVCRRYPDMGECSSK